MSMKKCTNPLPVPLPPSSPPFPSPPQLADFVLGIGSWGITVLKQLRYLATTVGGTLVVRTMHITRHLGHKGFGDRFHGGTPWNKAHRMQVKHNYWQYAKATHRWKHELKVIRHHA